MKNQVRHQQAVNRVASRHLTALSEGRQFVRVIEDALDHLKEALDIAEARSSDDYETGEALADWDSNVAQAIHVLRDFSAKINPLLRKIK